MRSWYAYLIKLSDKASHSRYRIGSHLVEATNRFSSPRDPDHWECVRCGAYFRTMNGRTPAQELLETGRLYANFKSGALEAPVGYYEDASLLYNCELAMVGRIHNS